MRLGMVNLNGRYVFFIKDYQGEAYLGGWWHAGVAQLVLEAFEAAGWPDPQEIDYPPPDVPLDAAGRSGTVDVENEA